MTADWSRYNLPAIYSMMQGENDCRRADRVKAWESLAEAVREQHRRLTTAADELAAVWPTQTDSAKAFQRQMAGLAQSMLETLKCAEDTRIGYRDVVHTLGDTTTKLFTLSQGRAEVSDDAIPRMIDGAEDEYDEKAQQLMREAEAAIALQSTNIKAPALFVMRPADHDTELALENDGVDRRNGDGAEVVRATPMPISVSHEPVHLEPGLNGVGADKSTAPELGLGPGLSGVTSSPPLTLPSPTSVPPGQSPVPNGPGVAPGLFGGAPAAPIPGATSVGFMPGILGGPNRTGVGESRQAVPLRQGLPSGAVIGQGPLNAGVQGTRGVVGQMPAGLGASRAHRPDGPDSTIDGNAAQLWQVREGVAPVIEPDDTPVRRDPGPGVLGIDR
jgi:hypothetical protein